MRHNRFAVFIKNPRLQEPKLKFPNFSHSIHARQQ